EAGVGKRNAKILLLMEPVVLDGRFLSEADGEIVVHRLIVQEIFLDHISPVSKAQNEITKAVMRVQLHDVPQDRAAADLNQRLRTELSFFTQARPETAAQGNYFHEGIRSDDCGSLISPGGRRMEATAYGALRQL